VLTTNLTRDHSPARSFRLVERLAAVLAIILLAGTLAATVVDSGSAAAQTIEPQGRRCFEARGVDGVALWQLCSGYYLHDEARRQQSARVAVAEGVLVEQTIDEWAYWPGHPGFLNETSSSIMQWVASPIQVGFTYPDDMH
jgi:hypothetical protein